MKKIAAVNDLSGFGRCSLTAAIPVISALGVECCPLPTGLYSAQTGYESFCRMDCTEFLKEAIAEWKKLNPYFDGILTGFILNESQGKIIADFIDSFKKEDTLVIVDPIMGDDGEIYKGFDESKIRAVKLLSEKADIITPNLTELCLLAERDFEKVSSLNDEEKFKMIFEISKDLSKKKERVVVTTGIHIDNGKIANCVFEKGEFNIQDSKSFSGSFSGTGDILSSFISARCVEGSSVTKAVEEASEFISKSITETLKKEGSKCYHADGIHFQKFLGDLN